MGKEMANVMQTAWKLARQAWVRFGGRVRAYFREALRMAWAGVTSLPGDRKTIARELDRMAMRAGASAATTKQVWFLAGLMAERGEYVCDLFGLNAGNMVLTGRVASGHIGDRVR